MKPLTIGELPTVDGLAEFLIWPVREPRYRKGHQLIHRCLVSPSGPIATKSGGHADDAHLGMNQGGWVRLGETETKTPGWGSLREYTEVEVTVRPSPSTRVANAEGGALGGAER